MEANNDLNAEQQQGSPVRKRLRVSSPLCEYNEEMEQKKARDESNAPTTGFAVSLGLTENKTASAEWSSSETMNEQKLHSPTLSESNTRAERTEYGAQLKDPDVGDVTSADKSENQTGAKALSSIAVPTTISVAQERKKTFPLKLHEILADEEVQETISWIPNGKAFVVKSQEKLVEEVLPKYFKEAKYESFTRKLNRWGFRRVSSDLHPDEPVYHHRLFKRDSPDLCTGMSGGTKKEHNPREAHEESVPAASAGLSLAESASMFQRPPPPPLSGLSVSPYHQSTQTSLETRLLEEQIATSVAEQILQEERMAARAMQMRALTAEVELRNHALGILQSPIGGTPSLALARSLGRGRYSEGGMLRGPSAAAPASPNPGGRSDIVRQLDARIALLLRRREAEEERNRIFRPNP